MTHKRRLIISLVFGLAFTLGSLLYTVGSGPVDPMPYTPTDGNQIVNGIIACLVCQAESSRGWPYPIVTLSADDDSLSAYYRGANWAGLLADYVIFTGVSFAALTGWTAIQRRRTKKSRP